MSSTRKRTYVVGKERAATAVRLRARYERGQTVRAIAEDVSMAYSSVHKLLRAAETPMRARGRRSAVQAVAS